MTDDAVLYGFVCNLMVNTLVWSAEELSSMPLSHIMAAWLFFRQVAALAKLDVGRDGRLAWLAIYLILLLW